MLSRFYIEKHIKDALIEDIGFGDITTENLASDGDMLEGFLNTRSDGVLCGVEVFKTVYEILSKDIKIDINEKDLKIDVYRSTGAGGQGVNTTDSAVRITHLPTKIVVTCQNERSQIQNKETALQVLKSKLYVLEEQKKEQELAKEKGIQSNIDFGSQIRSYILHPYSLVKDHRTGYETSDTKGVLDGKIDEFIESSLKGGLNEESDKS